MNNLPRKPKVVSIPIHFVKSTSAQTLSTSATKIQKVFRGFLVRKSIKEILAIGSDVNKAERKILDGLDSIRNDPKERLKMNETLMGLLFKLDSVRGVGPGVRDCRKAVIKKAIVLQEIIDGCDQSSADVADDVSGPDVVNRGTGMDCEDGVCREISRDFEMDGSDADVAKLEGLIGKMNGGDDVANGFVETQGHNVTNRDVEIEDMKIDGGDIFSADVANQVLREDIIEGGNDELVDTKEENDDKDYCFVKQVVVGEKEYNDAKLIEKRVENDCFEDELKTEKSSDKEVLEKMMEENGKMMSMMKQLYEQNQAQTQMLTMLSNRVEHLEKAFVCEILRKKNKDKKKRMANGVTEGLDFYLDQKKCGKKR